MGVGAAGGATKATAANVLKAKGHAHQDAAPARSSSSFKKTKGNYGPARIITNIPSEGCGGKKRPQPSRDGKRVNVEAPPGLPCAAPLVESRNGTRGTKPPRPAASTQLWELVCRPRKFCPMQTKTLYQPTTSNTVFEGGTQPVGAPNSLGFQSTRIAYAQ